MTGYKHNRAGSPVLKQRNQADMCLGAEIELMVRERERLLQAAGAAAALFATLNMSDLPPEARRSLCRLGVTLASLSDETLTDAFEQVLGEAESRPSPAHS